MRASAAAGAGAGGDASSSSASAASSSSSSSAPSLGLRRPDTQPWVDKYRPTELSDLVAQGEIIGTGVSPPLARGSTSGSGSLFRATNIAVWLQIVSDAATWSIASAYNAF